MSANTKQEKHSAVSVAVLEIVERDGLAAVTYSKVSRKSGVSRPWLYEYIGKEKSDLIDFAANELGAYFSRIDMTDLPQTKSDLKKRLKEGTKFLFEASDLHPTSIKLFFRYRGFSNPLGEIIDKYEKKWLEAASKTICGIFDLKPNQAEPIVEFVLTIRLGYAHRQVTSKDPKESKERALHTFEALYGLFEGALDR